MQRDGTPLSFAAYNNRISVVTYLLALGQLKGQNAEEAIESATRGGNGEVKVRGSDGVWGRDYRFSGQSAAWDNQFCLSAHTPSLLPRLPILVIAGGHPICHQEEVFKVILVIVGGHPICHEEEAFKVSCRGVSRCDHLPFVSCRVEQVSIFSIFRFDLSSTFISHHFHIWNIVTRYRIIIVNCIQKRYETLYDVPESPPGPSVNQIYRFT